jgi:hypothetical protein
VWTVEGPDQRRRRDDISGRISVRAPLTVLRGAIGLLSSAGRRHHRFPLPRKPDVYTNSVNSGVFVRGGIARTALRAGHRVLIANSRGPESLTSVVSELGDEVSPVTVDDARRRIPSLEQHRRRWRPPCRW